MEWFPLVSTAVGVLLGIGATTINERTKWKRDRLKARYESRGKLYGDYLADLTKTRDALRLAARGIYPQDFSRSRAADEAFAAGNIYARRYQIRVTSPKNVADLAREALRRLRELRTVIGDGHDHHSDQYNDKKIAYNEALELLVDAMEAEMKDFA